MIYFNAETIPRRMHRLFRPISVRCYRNKNHNYMKLLFHSNNIKTIWSGKRYFTLTGSVVWLYKIRLNAEAVSWWLFVLWNFFRVVSTWSYTNSANVSECSSNWKPQVNRLTYLVFHSVSREWFSNQNYISAIYLLISRDYMLQVLLK